MNLKFDQNKLEQICRENDIVYLALFGSHAVGGQREDSDVDLMVKFGQTKSLLEKGKALVAFQELFNKQIDLVSEKNIKPELKPFIEKQIVTLYEN